jgi:lipid A 4'-phosphatase
MIHRLIVLLFICFAALFLTFPEIDLYVSRLFWDGDQFTWAKHPMIQVIYYHVNVLTPIFITLSLMIILYQYVTKKVFSYTNIKNVTYFLLVGIIGSAILVNAVLKDNWGRARPHQVVEFHGEKSFSPPFIMTNQCERNCSFVSGHASFGFMFIGLWFLFRKKWLLWSSIMYGALIGGVRIVQGGHFLSDVIFSFFVMYTTAYILYRWMYKEESLA